MFVLVHVLIALSSVGYTTYLYFSPSRAKFYAAYGLVGATVASGTYLVISTHTQILSACITGLVYIGLVSVGLVAAHRHFAYVTNKIKDTKD